MLHAIIFLQQNKGSEMKLLRKLKNISQLTKDRIFAFVVAIILVGVLIFLLEKREGLNIDCLNQYYQEIIC